MQNNDIFEKNVTTKKRIESRYPITNKYTQQKKIRTSASSNILHIRRLLIPHTQQLVHLHQNIENRNFETEKEFLTQL